MKTLGSRKDSGAATSGADHSPTSGDANLTGFTKAAYPDTGPVEHNADTPTSGPNFSAPVMGSNLGTSRDSYKLQPQKIDAVEGWGKTESAFDPEGEHKD